MAPDQYLPVFAFPSGRHGDVREADFDSVQPKVTLSWRPNDDWTDLRHLCGGIPQRRLQSERRRDRRCDARRCRRAGLAARRAATRTSQEDTEGFELGFKSTLLDGALRFDAALFDTEVDERLHVRVRRAVHGADHAQHQGGGRQRRRDEPLVARDGASPARRGLGLPRLGDHRQRLGRRRRHQHHRQEDAAESRLDGEPRRWSIAASSAATANGTRGSTIGASARCSGSRRTSSRATRCRSSTCASESRARGWEAVVVDRQRDRRGLDLRGVESERHRLLRQTAAVRRRAHVSLLKTLDSVEGESG